jgi:hypothetical protein
LWSAFQSLKMSPNRPEKRLRNLLEQIEEREKKGRRKSAEARVPGRAGGWGVAAAKGVGRS